MTILYDARSYLEIISKKIAEDNMGLLTVYKYLEKRLPYHGEDILINQSCQIMIKNGRSLSLRQIRRLCQYAGMSSGNYSHYAVTFDKESANGKANPKDKTSMSTLQSTT